ncbi:MAG: aldo/keto reductase, partial [Algoriella sp.]
MRKVQLGNTDLEITPIIFGGNVFGWTLNEEESFRILDAFIARGFNAIDTANNYSYWVPGNVGTESERIIGNWIKSRGNRDKIILATKVGGRNLIQDKPNTTKSHILKEVEESLLRLNTDYIDLYQTHYDDTKTPVEETLSAYNQLVKEGKVRYIGASNFSSERLIESLEKSDLFNLPAYKTLQPEYNLYDRQSFEEFLQPVAEKFKLGVIPYYSLASGFLS